MLSWSAKARHENFSAVEPVRFTTATLVQNAYSPHGLTLEGRLEHLQPVLRPGRGIVLWDGDGNLKFSGPLVSARRKGDRNGVAMFASDSVRLWWRFIWPTPGSAWETQTTAYDTVTAAAETRALHYIDKNAGPGAYKQFSTGTVPVGTITPASLVTLDPSDKTRVFQGFDQDLVSGDFYATQAQGRDNKPDHLWIARYDKDGSELSRMYLPGGGHGYEFSVVRHKGKVHCVFPYRTHGGTWVRIPYTGGKEWSAAKVEAYKIDKQKFYPGDSYAAAPPKSNPDPEDLPWFQGEAQYDGKFYRLYGAPFIDSGFRPGTQNIPARIDVIQNGVKVDQIDIPQLGRGSDGKPIKGQLEPEGLAVGMVLDQPSLLIGISVGKPADNNVDQRIYSLSLAPKATPVLDRRWRRLRVPTSLGRGDVAKSSMRFQQLGPAVATILEASDLRLDVVQTYDGETPWLDVVVTEAPDLTDSIRVGTPEEGGPIVLGRDWSYLLEIDPTTYASTILSGNGGSLTNRILTQATDLDRQAFWGGERIERFINQNGVTDSAEIATGMADALLEAIDTTEISVPLGRSAYGWGTDEIPLGSKISAVLDGQVVTERIRQITTVIAKRSGEQTVTTTAVLGSPDAGVKSPTQKKIARMLKRLQDLERT